MKQRSCRRQLSFTSSQSPVCALCGRTNSRMSTRKTWKDDASNECAASMGIDESSLVCRPCRDDIARVVQNSNHTPRWVTIIIIRRGKRVTIGYIVSRWATSTNKENCFIPNCDGEQFTLSTSITIDELNELGLCNAVASVPSPLPLCKHHYYLAKNKQAKTQTHCPTCNVSLRGSKTRTWGH